MNNKNITRIKQLEAQVAALKKMTSTDDYLAAGLTIGLHVGPLHSDEDYDTKVEVTSNLHPIIRLISESLKEQISERIIYAKSELAELQSFLDERKQP